jgi:hypothetical protein
LLIFKLRVSMFSRFPVDLADLRPILTNPCAIPCACFFLGGHFGERDYRGTVPMLPRLTPNRNGLCLGAQERAIRRIGGRHARNRADCCGGQLGYNVSLDGACARKDPIMMYEDFGDEPSVEERMPFGGISPEEMLAVSEEILRSNCCELCGLPPALGELVETGMYEYYTMDLDPGTRVCEECLESHRTQYIPDNPMLFDCYTPLACV